MKRIHLLALAALAATSTSFANDVDFHPNGFVSSVIHEAQTERDRLAAKPKATREANADKSQAPAQKGRAKDNAEVAQKQSQTEGAPN